MTKDLIAKFTRNNVKAKDRLPNFVTNIINKHPFNFINSSHLLLSIVERDSWAKHCLIPWDAFKQIALPTTHFDFFNPNSIYKSVKMTNDLYYASLWNLSKGIYIFNDDLVSILPHLNLDDRITGYALLNLPEWCIYLETKDLDIQNIRPYGIFVTTNYNQVEGFFLRIGVDLDKEIFSVDFPLNCDMTYRTALKDELSIRKTKLEIGFSKNNDEDYIEINVDEFITKIIEYIIPRLQYICSKNRDIKNISHPKQPIRRASFLFNNKLPTLTCAQNYSEILVGESISNSTQDDQKISQIIFSENKDNELEANHKNIKSIQEIIQSEFDSIDLLKQIKTTLEGLNKDVKNLRKEISTLETDNQNLLEEGTRYHTELSQNNFKSKQLEEKYEEIYIKYQNALSLIESLRHSLRRKTDAETSNQNTITESIINTIKNHFISDKNLWIL